MQISYFCFNGDSKSFEIISEYVSNEQLESSYDVKEVTFKEKTLSPKAVYNIQNIGVFCFCDKNNEITKENIDCELKFTISFKSKDSQPIFSEYCDEPVFLEAQNIFSSLINSGVSLKKFFISDKNSISFLIKDSSVEKIRSDFYFSKLFIKKIYFSQNRQFVFGLPGKKDLELQISFGEDSQKIKEAILKEYADLNFSEQKINHVFSNEENFLDSLFNLIISN